MLSDVQDPEKIFEEIESGILTSAAEVLPLKEKISCDWMSAETKNAIGDKHTIRKKHGSKSKEYKAAKAT